ncbi:MAG: ABC transporter ATP-binding protein, partial [Proteobacteria bacterium]
MEVVFKGIFKRYGQVTAVNNLNLKIEKGALHFLLGPSGCGKTTTLRMLAGLEAVSEGQLFFDGKDVTKQPAVERGIGMVFQNYALWPHMTVYKNVEYGLKLRKLSKEEIKRRIDEVLEITHLTNFADRLPGQLSGGQQQRVALARALAIRPNVLLLDEPLSNLDAKLRMEMRDNILRIHKQTGITTLYVTHDQREALSMGTSVSVMHAGHLIQTDNPRMLYTTPKTAFIAGFIGETNPVEAVVDQVNGSEITVKTSFGLLRSTHQSQPFAVGD